MKNCKVILTLLVGALTTAAQTPASAEQLFAGADEVADTLAVGTAEATGRTTAEGHRERTVRPQENVVPAAMITLGAVAVGNPRLREMKYDVRDAFQRGRGHHRKANVENVVTLTTTLTAMALGPKAKHSFGERMLMKATSYALLYTTMPVVSRCVREPRPDGHSKHGFPSFKTANAFLVAEHIRIERGWAWGMGAYAMATGVGVLQMYNDRCYVNDVLAGAGMGILCTHAAYWLLPAEKRLFQSGKNKRKRREADVVLLPTYDNSTKTAGLAFSAQL